MVGNIQFLWFFAVFLCVAVHTVNKLQFLSFITVYPTDFYGELPVGRIVTENGLLKYMWRNFFVVSLSSIRWTASLVL